MSPWPGNLNLRLLYHPGYRAGNAKRCTAYSLVICRAILIKPLISVLFGLFRPTGSLFRFCCGKCKLGRVRACTHAIFAEKRPRGCKQPPYSDFPQQKLFPDFEVVPILTVHFLDTLPVDEPEVKERKRSSADGLVHRRLPINVRSSALGTIQPPFRSVDHCTAQGVVPRIRGVRAGHGTKQLALPRVVACCRIAT